MRAFTDRALAELEAESVAYVVCSGLGLETDAYSFGYVAPPGLAEAMRQSPRSAPPGPASRRPRRPSSTGVEAAEAAPPAAVAA